MRVLPFVCLLIGCCLAAPSDPAAPAPGTESVVIDDIVKNSAVLYTAEHDIVRIFAPLNQFKFKQDPWADEWTFSGGGSSSEEEQVSRKIFFVEADFNNGKKTEQGLYVYNNGKVTKLLDNGRDAVANNENVVYFGASNGIYKYNKAANTAEKYGTVTDNIVQLAFYNITDTIYYVTANHEVFKLNAEATASEKVSQIKDVQAIVFGYDRKIYYQDSQNNVYVYDDVNNVAPKKIEGLPAKIDKLALVSPLLGMEEGSILLADKDVYFIKPDATASKSKAKVEVRPTAYEGKPTYIQFYAENKKLHEIDVLAIAAKLSGLVS